MSRAVIGVAFVVLLTGCGASTGVVDGEPGEQLARDGAAERALECDGDPYLGGGGDYVDGGLESVQGSAEDALENWLDNEAWAYQVPETGYQVKRDEGDRVLLSYDTAGRTKIAFIAADGIRDYNDDEGWGVESWAGCDPAELPTSVTEALGIGVWEDASGRRVPVTKVRSFQGAVHCDWQEITFLELGPENQADEYVRDPTGELADFLRTTYDATAAVPDGATDTGLRRDGRQLWLGRGHEAAYLVSLADPHDVERWPAAKQPIGCA